MMQGLSSMEELLPSVILGGPPMESCVGESSLERSEVIRASETFDKVILVKDHLRSYRSFDQGEDIFLNFTINKPMTEATRQSAIELASLRAIELPELRIGKTHGGRVVYGKLCVDAFKVSDIFTVLEDDSGRAIRVQINNVASATSTFLDVQRLYPKGTELAIKEPYVKRGSSDGCVMIRVDNPKTIEFISPSTKSSFSVEELRKSGNRCFGDKNWMGAIRFYTECIEKCKRTGAGEGTAISSSTSSQNLDKSRTHDLVLSYGNRAEAWLRVGNFEQALLDCNEALGIDSQHLKAVYRKGRALRGLQQYEEAISCLQLALKLSAHGSNIEIKSCLQRSVEFNTQSQTGKYDLAKYFLQRSRENAPEVGDYVGPVVIKQTADGRGRGLFVTENVKTGDFLLVSNALAFGFVDAHRSRIKCKTNYALHGLKFLCSQDLVEKLVNLAKVSRKALLQLSCMAYSNSTEETCMEVPSMDLFRPNKAYSYCNSVEAIHAIEKLEAINAREEDLEKRIIDILRLNAFGGEISVENPIEGECTGLWILPSFLNHSCLPNATKLLIGEAMFVHATRDIRAAEEIGIEYFDALAPFAERSEKSRRWGFTCNCKRCNLERSLQMPLEHVIAKYARLWIGISDGRSFQKRTEAMFNPSDLAEITKFVKELESKVINSSEYGLNWEEKQWIRASFHTAYMKAISYTGNGTHSGTVPTIDNLVDSLKLTDAGYPEILRITAKLALMQLGTSAQKQDALRMAREACVAVIGNQEEDVINAFIRDPLLLSPLL
eukprot:Gb_23533 [translate_table: standard]